MMLEIYDGQGNMVAGIGVEKLPHRKSPALVVTTESGRLMVVGYLRREEDTALVYSILQKLTMVKGVKE